jgi:hypothetical protein
MQTLPQFKVLERSEQPPDEGYHVLLVHRFSSDWRALVHDITGRVPPSAGKVCHLTQPGQIPSVLQERGLVHARPARTRLMQEPLGWALAGLVSLRKKAPEPTGEYTAEVLEKPRKGGLSPHAAAVSRRRHGEPGEARKSSRRGRSAKGRAARREGDRCS